MDFVVRKFKPDDLDRIAELEKQLFSAPWSKNSIWQSCNIGYSWVLEHNDSGVIGYLIGELVLDEFSIYNFAVKTEFQRKGCGIAMLKFLEEYLVSQKCKKVFLEVRSKNQKALNLYLKYGFISIYIRKNYYHDPVDDAVLMVYNLKEKEVLHEKV